MQAGRSVAGYGFSFGPSTSPLKLKAGLSGPPATLLGLANRLKRGYTLGMKTAVSIPNELFDVAERLARRSRKSRSRLFSDALREYVARRSPDRITEAMDEALAEIGESNDPFVAAVSRTRLEQSEW
jgi:predicted transcriptional regulator